MNDKNIRFKGFTLIELLATIIILAVIALIAIPQILNVIDNSKKESFRNSVSGIIRAVQQHYADDLEYELDDIGLYYSVDNGNLYLHDNDGNIINIPYSGELKTATGQIIVQSDERIYATVDYSKWCAIKRRDSSKVEVYKYGDENCHDELLNPTLNLYAKKSETNEEYISGEWTSESIILIAVTDSIDTTNYEFKWYRDGIEISDSNSYTYEVTNQQENALYKYSIITSEGKNFDSNEILVKIDKVKPSCDIILDGTVTQEGWYLDNVVAKLDKSHSYSEITNYGLGINLQSEYNHLDELVITDNGTYEVYGIVENALGKSEICYKSVNKDDVTNFTVAISAVLEGTDTIYTSGTISTSNIVLTGSVNPATNVSGYTYQWYKDNEKIEDEKDIQYKAISSGDYYLEVTAGNGIVKKSETITLKIDTARPTCSLDITSGTLGSNGWYTSDVVVGLTKTNAAKYGITTSSGVSYNGETSVTIDSTSNVYCYVANESGLSTNSNNKMINIDKTKPIIRSLSGTSVAESGYNTTSLQLTALASDAESEISKYEFYKVTQSTSKETLLGSNTTGIYKISNPTGGYDYKVKVYNNAGLVNEKTLTESCSLSTTGTCYSGTRTNIYTCTTGRQYSVTTSTGCTSTTTTTTSSSGGNPVTPGGADDCQTGTYTYQGSSPQCRASCKNDQDCIQSCPIVTMHCSYEICSGITVSESCSTV